MSTAGGKGGALDASVEAVPGTLDADAVGRARLLHEEAVTAVERVRDKVEKLAAHLAGAKESLRVAEAEEKAAAKHLSDVEGGH